MRLSVDAYPNEVFTAKVRFVSPALKSDQRALTVEAVAPNTDGRLKPGLFATALLQQPAPAPAMLVPAAAVETVAGTSRVYVIAAGDKVEERIVTLGEKVGDRIELATGVKARRDRSRRIRAASWRTACACRSKGEVVMQWLAAISVKRPVFASVLILALTVIGAFAFTRLGLDRFPEGRLPHRRGDDAAARRGARGSRNRDLRQDRGSRQHHQRHRRAALDLV